MNNEIMEPKLRFKSFNDHWEEKKLDEIADIISGGTPSTNNTNYWNGSISWITPNEINTKYIYSSEKNITELGLKKSSAKILPKNNTLLFTSRAGIGKTSILKENSTTNQGFQSLVLYKENDIQFFYSLSNLLKKKALQLAFGSTFLEISNSNMKKIKIKITDYNEQQKIGSFFEKLDRIIELQENKIEHWQNLKKGYLQKAFVYNNSNYDKLLNLIKLKTGNKNAEDDIYNGKYAFFDRSSILKHLNTYDFNEEAIIFPGEGSDFKPKYFHGKYSLHQRAYSLYNPNNSLDIKYLYYYLITQNNNFKKYSVGTTAKSLRKISFEKINVPLITIYDQEKIGEYFSKLDKIIDLQEKKLKHLKQLKKGYLQNMFC